VALIVGRAAHVDGILGRIGADGNARGDGAGRIVGSIAAESALERCPTGFGDSAGGDELFDVCDGRLRAGVDGLELIGRELRWIEVLTGNKADAGEIANDGCVGSMRGIGFEGAREGSKEDCGFHGLDAVRWSGSGSAVKIGRRAWRLIFARILTEGYETHAVLKGVDIVVVACAVGLRAAEQPDLIGGRVEASDVIGEFAVPTGTDDREPCFAGTGGALAGVGEGFGPCVHELEQVEATGGIGNMEKDGLAGNVDPSRRVEGVCVGTDDEAKAGVGKFCNVGEVVDRHDRFCGLKQDEGIGVDIGALCDRLQIARGSGFI